MNIVILLSAIFVEIFVIQFAFGVNKNPTNEVNQNQSINERNSVRFQRILKRKRRFLLFPPGAAIVTTMSYTKTLVPRSPSGINMIGECDIFYPLQNMIKDFYPTKPPNPPPHPPPPPPPPEQEQDGDGGGEDDNKQGVLPGNVGPLPPNEPLSMAVLVQRPSPPIDTNAPPPNGNQPFLPTRLPTDQEIGITPATIISDPNFNVGSNPGEIYVNDNGKSSRKTPPRRYYSKYSKYYPSSASLSSSSASLPYQSFYPYQSIWNTTGNSYQNIDVNDLNRDSVSPSWHRVDENLQYGNSIYSDGGDNSWQFENRNDDSFDRSPAYTTHTRNVWSRGSRERRNIFDQLESMMSLRQFDTKSCILRMICEAKHYLLPPGKSLFHDIFRIFLTLPTDDGPVDEYARATQATEDDCNSIYSDRCPFSILGLLLNKNRPNF